MVPLLTVNGSNLVNHTWNTTLEPFINLFIATTGTGDTLWLMIISVLTIGIFIISDHHPLYTSMFMVSTGSILASVGFFNHMPVLAALFTVFTAIGLATGFLAIYLQRR